MKKLSYSIIALLLSAGIVCFAVKFTAGQTADAEVPKVENVEKKSHVGKMWQTNASTTWRMCAISTRSTASPTA